MALLRARAATWEQSKATQVLAQTEFDRAKKLARDEGDESHEEFRSKARGARRGQGAGQQAMENVYQARAALGLPGKPPEGKT